MPEPDFALLYEPNPVLTPLGHFRPSDIRLVVEVSDATLSDALTTKARLYAGAGIPEYWVVDVAGRRLRMHSVPGAEGYTQITEFSESDTAAPVLALTASFVVSEILP